MPIVYKATGWSYGGHLMHYGVPGQKWGVITKEYEPVAVDHRRTGNAEPQQSRPRTFNLNNGSSFVKKSGKPENRKPISPAAQRQKIVERALIGVGIATALLAVYGTMRYRHIQKAKAYSGLLERFVRQNPGTNMTDAAGRALLGKGNRLAIANSKKYKDAVLTNKHLRSIGIKPGRKEALRMYKSRRLMKRVSEMKAGKSKVSKFMNDIRRQKLINKIASRVRS